MFYFFLKLLFKFNCFFVVDVSLGIWFCLLIFFKVRGWYYKVVVFKFVCWFYFSDFFFVVCYIFISNKLSRVKYIYCVLGIKICCSEVIKY